MKNVTRAQLAVLAGVFGFFAGGLITALISAGREIVDIMLGAAVGWGVLFFAVFTILNGIYGSAPDTEGEHYDSPHDTGIRPAAGAVKSGKTVSKGEKIDITVKNDVSFDDIYKTK